ncbi:unnamed protein product [Alternaria alternata]
MDPLSITSSLINSAQIAGEAQTLLDASKESSSALSRIRFRVAALRNMLDILAQDIMRADRTMFSSQTIDVAQPVLMRLSETLQNLLKIIQRSHLAESQKPHRRLLRIRDEASLQEISEELDQQESTLHTVVTLITLQSLRTLSVNLGDDQVLNSHKRPQNEGNQHDTFLSEDEMVTEHRIIHHYVKKLDCTQRRYFNKVLFESATTYQVRLTAAHDKDVKGSAPLAEFDETLLETANPESILFPMSDGIPSTKDLAIILCEALKSSNTIPFEQEVFVKIMEKLEIPAGIYQALLTGTPKSVLYTAGEHVGFVLRTPVSGSENWTLALSWYKGRPGLRGIIFGLQETEKSRLAMHLGDRWADSAHAMNIPIILCEMLVESDSTGVKTHASDLYQVELRTNFHGYPLSSDSPSQLGKTPEKDFEDMTRSLNIIISRFAFHEMRIHANAVFVDQILSHINTGDPPPDWDKKLTPVIQSLEDRLNHLQTEQCALLLEISCNQKIAQSQLQIVYNLIAQRDNKDSLAMAELQTELARIQTTIANTTKEDSYAMRTIAVMSILFLPGTFVSSFFSMDMFDWQAPKGASVVSFRLWIYWAVTAPLTVVVVSIWFLWLRTHKKHEVDGQNDSTLAVSSSNPIVKPDPNGAGKQSWFRRQRARVLAKDEEKHAVDAIRIVHRSFAAEPVESRVRIRTPTAQVQRRGTVLAGPVR